MSHTSNQTATWRSEALGPRRALRLPQGTLYLHECGSGPPLVFVHGALVNANLWRKVIPPLAADFRCIALDLPIGAHLEPMPPSADLSAPAIAEMIADALAALDLDGVTLIGNDTGGALCQLVATTRPERLGALVLTSCDAFDNFPPKMMQPAMPLLRAPGVLALVLAPMRLRALRRRMLPAIRATKRPVDSQATDSYTLPALQNRAVRRDARKLMLGLDKRLTLDAAQKLRSFDRPALIAWSREDKFFPPRHAEQLAELLPDARLEWIEDSYTFSPEDQPEQLAIAIGAFVRETRGVARAEA